MKFRILLMCAVVAVACRKYPIDLEKRGPHSVALTEGMFVLNEGLFQHNNARLQFFPKDDQAFDYFEEVIGRPLGDTGNDMKRYGSKLYVLVNVSSTLEVIDLNSGKSLKQLEMSTSTGPKQPRYLAFYGDKVLVSCYDGYVDIIDTTEFQVQKRVKVGQNPEQMCVIGDQLYVANSGGLNFPNVDSTLSIVNLTTWQEHKITVGLNPGNVACDKLGNVYVIARGDYNTVPSKLVRYSPSNQTTTTLLQNVSKIASFDQKMLLAYTENSTTKLGVFEPFSGVFNLTDFIPLNDHVTFYNVQYSAENQKVYTFDARSYVNTGLVRQYSKTGELEATFESQIIPTSIYYHVP